MRQGAASTGKLGGPLQRGNRGFLLTQEAPAHGRDQTIPRGLQNTNRENGGIAGNRGTDVLPDRSRLQAGTGKAPQRPQASQVVTEPRHAHQVPTRRLGHSPRPPSSPRGFWEGEAAAGHAGSGPQEGGEEGVRAEYAAGEVGGGARLERRSVG